MQRIKSNKLFRGQMVLFDTAFLGVLCLVLLFFPFAQYTFKKVGYTVSGLEFITGVTLKGGTLDIPLQGLLIVSVVAAFAATGISFLFPLFKKVRPAGLLLFASGATMAVANISFASGINNTLAGLSKTGPAYGVWVCAALGAIIVARAIQILYTHKVVSALDFMLLPGALYLLINNYIPMAGMVIAFQRVDFSKGIWGGEWVGFANFKYLFTTQDAWVMTRNTVLYNIAFIVVGTALGILVAILLFELFSKKLQKLFQTTILLPQLISMIIVAYIVFAFISNEAGLVNKSILAPDKNINFYNETAYWPFILIFVNAWKGLGYTSIIYMSAIAGIDRSIYEACYVDGAGRIRQVFSITIPLLKPTIITLFILNVGRIFFSDFGLFYQIPMNSGALYPVTQTIDTYVYRSLIQLNNVSMASAASVYQSIVGFVIVLLANALVRKIDKENAMF